MYTTKSQIILGLLKIRGIGNAKVQDLFNSLIKSNEHCPSILEAIHKQTGIELHSVWPDVVKDLEYANEKKIKITTIADPDFPIIFSDDIPKADKPVVLFYIGDLSLLHHPDKNISIIGTRTPDLTGSSACVQLVQKSISLGFNIISGLANGCDSIAHQTTCKLSGKTIAVLPTPPNNPKINIELARDILRTGGLLISEYLYPDKTKTEYSRNCAKRDKLVVMFSKKVLLVSGTLKSGSEIAVQAANKYHIPVYAVIPGVLSDAFKFELNLSIVKSGDATPIYYSNGIIDTDFLTTTSSSTESLSLF